MGELHRVVAISDNITLGATYSPRVYTRIVICFFIAILPLVIPGIFVVGISIIAVVIFTFDLYKLQDAASFLMPYPWPQMIKAGFLLLFVSLIHTIMILLGFSALSYALVMRYQFANPFGIAFSRIEIVVFYLDQAVKGSLFGLLDTIGLGIHHKLTVQFRDHWAFASAVLILRMIVMTAVLNGARNMYKSSKRWYPINFNGKKMLVNLYAIENKLVTDDNIKLVLQNAAKEDAVVELAPGGAVKVDAVVSAPSAG